MPTLRRRVASSADDGYVWKQSGNVNANYGSVVAGDINTSLYDYMGYFIFRNVTIPKGREIFSAKIQGKSANKALSPAQTQIVVALQVAPEPPESKTDYFSRPRTGVVLWTQPDAWLVDQTKTSPNFGALIADLTGRPSWVEGDDVLVFWEVPPAHRGSYSTNQTNIQLRSYDASPANAVELIIEYQSEPYGGAGTANGSPQASGSAETTNPAYSATGAAQTAEPTATGSGQTENITYTGSGTADASPSFASAEATHNYPPSEGAGLATMRALTASGTGEMGAVLYQGVGTATAPLSASGSATTENISYTSAGFVDATPVVSGTGETQDLTPYTSTGYAVAAQLTASGVGRHLLPTVLPKPRQPQHVRLLNRSREVLAILDRCNPPTWTRKRNEATEITVSVPRTDAKLPYAQIAALVEVWEDDRKLIGGRISGRDVGNELVTLSAMTEEILLEQHVCPVNYSQVLANQDLADVARRCLDGWYTLRVNRDWTARRVGSSQVDLTTQPGAVMIERANGAYKRNGYIYQRFAKSEIPRFKDWERVRWASDFDPPVFTTLQFGYWRSGVFSGWRPTRQVSVGSTTGVGERGVLPESVGLNVSEATSADYLDVGCRLYTDDTESQEEDTQETKGVTPLYFGLEVVARTHGHVGAGSIPNSAGVTVKSVEASGTSALGILKAACDQVNYEYRVIDGKLDLAKQFGRSRVNDFLLTG